MIGASSVKALSDRELYVFNCSAPGLLREGCDAQLGVSLKTIQSHRENIKRKLGFRDGAEHGASCRQSICRHAFSCLSSPVASRRRAELALPNRGRI